MEVSISSPVYAGENETRTARVSVEAPYRAYEIRLAFLTPAGKRCLSPAIPLTNGEGDYPLPACLLDAPGALLMQPVALGGEGKVLKGEIFPMPVERSVSLQETAEAEGGLITLFTVDSALEALRRQVEGCAKTEDLPTVPQNVSAFTNDAGYLALTEVDAALSGTSDHPVRNKAVTAALNGKQDALVFDAAPTANSENMLKSGAVFAALQSIRQPTAAMDAAPTPNSENAVKSGGVYAALQGKQNTLTFDNSPTSGSINPVKSGGVYTALAGKQNTLTFDNAPTAGSNNPVKSGGINTAIATAASALRNEFFYKAGDSLDYTGSGVMLHVYGNVRGSTSNTMRLVFPVPKLIPPELKVHFTALTLASVVIGTGGTVETEGFNALSYIPDDSPPTVWGNEIQVKLQKSGGWLKNGVTGDKVPQNTAVTGFIRAAFYFSTT